MNAIGCDVSRWNDANSTPQMVDFEKMKAAGADFVFIKASQANWADEDIIFNWNNALAAGMLRGAYHFLDWIVDPVKQADYFCDLIEHDPGELPPVCDFEWWNMDNMPSNASTILKRFLERVELRLGVVPMIYTAPGFWQPYGSTDPYWKHYYLWIASWGNMNPSVPAPWTEYTFHQWTDKGDGLKYGTESLNVDMNQFNGTTADLLKFAGVEVEPEPEPPPEEEPNVWKDKALGLYTDPSHPIVDIEKYSYIFAKIGTKENYIADRFFHQENVGVAYKNEIPCIAMVEHHITNWHLEMTFDENDWKREIENEDIIKRLDKMLVFANGEVNIAVHGIALDCSYVTDETGKVLTYNWYTDRCRFMLNTIYSRYHLPIYMYMNKEPIDTYNTGVAKEAVYKLCKDFGVSVVDWAAGVTEDDLPFDNDQPWQPFVGADYPWYFWLFDNSPLRFLYNGTVEELYKALEYEAYPPFPPDPEPDPDDEPLLERVEDLELIVIEMSDDLEEMKQRIQALENWINKPL